VVDEATHALLSPVPGISSSGITMPGCPTDIERRRLRAQALARLSSLAVRGATVALPDSSPDDARTYEQHQIDHVPRITRSITGRRCVQFLNVAGDRAVRLRTPYFACGFVSQPVTIFICAVALVDGCILSGLRRRFEVGHMYPDSSRDALIDMSSVCVSASQKDPPKEAEVGGGFRRTGASGGLVIGGGATGSDSETEAGSGYSSSSNGSSTMSVPPENCIHRGTIGPGAWHCYTVVMDGKGTEVRVDGRREEKAFAGGCGDGVLDGLTLGADHHFDFPLCDGGALEGDGEGTIAEVAAFKGRMDEGDIECIERRLMAKHGISPGTKMSPIEDEWGRQVQALIAQPHPWKLEGRVPLRIAARHHSVAWYRANKVTGEDLHVPRIGSKLGTGSSDW